jgi:hypothetical protein
VRKSSWAIPVLSLFAGIGAPTVLRADVTYTVNLGTGIVTGTITTGGETGILDTGDIVSWNLTINDGTDSSAALISTDSSVEEDVFGSGLTATPNNLSFTFTGGGESFLILQDFVTNYYLCYLNGTAACDIGGTTNGITGQNSSNLNLASIGESGTQVIASTSASTPEPGTAMLLLAGIGLLGLVMRRRIDQGRRPPTETHRSPTHSARR